MMRFLNLSPRGWIQYSNLLLALLLLTTAAAAQTAGTVEVPEQMKFANIKLELDKDARAAVQKKVNGLMRSQTFFNSFVDRCDVYFPLIEKIFEEEGLPEDFKFLALQESALIADAVSRSNAVGFWQFKEATARELGLAIDKDIDERKNILEASRAAAKYLKKNNYFMRNWIYTLLSYNLGLTGANSVLDRSLIGAERMVLDKETHIYIIHMLAHKVAFEEAVGKNNSPNRIKLIEYPSARGKKIADIAKETGIDPALINQYNRWMDGEVVPRKFPTPPLLVPVKAKDEKALVAKIGGGKEGQGGNSTASSTEKTPSLSETQRKQNKYPVITAKRKTKMGGQVVTLAQSDGIPAVLPSKDTDMASLIGMLDVSRKKFLKYNDMGISSELHADMPYYLKKKKGKTPTDAEFHVLQYGEDLWEVSQRYGIRLKSLLNKNRIGEDENVEPGRVLWLKKKRPRKVPVEVKDLGPKPKNGEDEEEGYNEVDEKKLDEILEVGDTKSDDGPVTPVVTDGRFHIVQKGETLYAISRAYKISTLKLKELNNLPEDLSLTEGQILIVREDVVKRPETNDENIKDPLDAIKDEVVRIDENGNVITGEAPAKTGDSSNGQTADNSGSASPSAVVHIVRPQENLYTIANIYGVQAQDIVRWNKLDPLKVLSIGQKLYVSDPEGAPVKPINPAPVKNVQAKKHTVAPGETLYGISRKYGIGVEEIIAWNKINNQQPISIGQQLFVENPNATVTVGSPAGSSSDPVYHKVKAGENLPTIAYGYGTTVESILALNNLTKSDILVEGQTLLIKRGGEQPPSGGGTQRGTSTGASTPTYTYPSSGGQAGTTPGASAKTHVVRKGDTVYGLSRAYGISVEQLKVWNGLKDNSLSIGQTLMVGYSTGSGRPSSGANTGTAVNNTPAVTQPVATPTPTTTKPVSGPIYHVVKKGDTLYSIARNNNLSVNQLKILNSGLTNALSIGQKIRVK